MRRASLDHRSRQGSRRPDSTPIYFDAQTTDRRADAVKKAIAAGKHIYCEKPIADSLDVALELLSPGRERQASSTASCRTSSGCPACCKLQDPEETWASSATSSRVRGEFGYWVFEGDTVPAQRPSWNYRKEDGGGIIIDMLCHWRYVLDNLFGAVKAVSCLGATHIPHALGRGGQALRMHRRRFRLRHLRAGRRHHRALQFVLVRARAARRPAHASRWMARKGIGGRGPARLLGAALRRHAATRRGIPISTARSTIFDGWQKVPEQDSFDNAFKRQWELFLRHVVKDEPFRWDLLEGAKGVQLAEKGLESWQKRAWVEVPALRA